MKILLISLIAALSIFVSGCGTDAQIASYNLSKDADQFKINRRIVFYNGFTDEYILSIQGRCSVEFLPRKFEVTCKKNDGSFVKHYLGRADNAFPFIEQIDPAIVGTSQYKVIFKPSVIIPDIEMK